MASRNVFIRIILFCILDLAAINCAHSLVFFSIFRNSDFEIANRYFFILINVSWVLSAMLNKLYRDSSVQTMGSIWHKTQLTFSLQVVFIGLVSSLIKSPHVNELFIFYSLLAELVALAFVRLLIYLTEQNYRQLHSYKRTIAIIGYSEASEKVALYFKRNKVAFNFAGHYKELGGPGAGSSEKMLYAIQFAIENQLDEVYTTMPASDDDQLLSVIKLAEQHCVKIRFITTFSELEQHGAFNYSLNGFCDGIPILTSRPEPLNTLNNRILKRLFDIVFSSLIIIGVLSWLMPLIALLIKLESPGPVIFKQLRSGKNNKPFWCYKFRSMRLNESSNHLQASKNDQRVTKTGAILRRTSIDELPQFFNVLFGNMSVVGPRPHMVSHTDQYRLVIEQYMMRLFSKPGITGWAQVNGYRGETRDQEQMRNRVNYDIWYLENWSIIKDINITYKTLLNALHGETNAY